MSGTKPPLSAGREEAEGASWLFNHTSIWGWEEAMVISILEEKLPTPDWVGFWFLLL